MKTRLKILSLVSTLALTLSLSALGQTVYHGNGGTGFGGPVGQGSLTFSTDGTTLFGTITPGPNNGAGNAGTLYDELVIYIDSKLGGVSDTSAFTDTGGGSDILRKAVSGYDGTTRSIVTFAAPFAADYVLALSPNPGSFGGLFALDNPANFTFIQSANLTPTGSSDNPVTGPYTFSIALANFGSTGSFTFSTTYLNAHTGLFRSDEAFGNSITFTTGNDAAAGFSTFAVPEPRTWVTTLVGLGTLLAFRRRLRRA